MKIRSFVFRLRNKRRVHSATRTNQKVEVCDAIPEVNAELGLGHTEKLLYIERVRKHEDVVVLSERIWLPERLFKNLKEIPIAEFGNLLYPFIISTVANLFLLQRNG